ncbi:MAG: Loki-CTERM sorting domain-containing protein [Candidatus Lokiarchaeota archaeon]|nr:Loki-CTERM sorting domain-containing protein [Candidatus Lokiarchaeota archaeon]
MKSNTKSNLIIIGILLALLPIFMPNLSYTTSINNKILDYNDVFNLDDKNLKISAVSGRIHIDNNWTAAKSAGICAGNGTYSEPYIIEDLVIDANNTGSCILIENSSVYFKIENCTLYNSEYRIYPDYGFRDWTGGIKLYNCSNGILINNNCSFNYIGIYLLNCIDITVSANNASDNYHGIYLTYVGDDDALYKYTTQNIIMGNTASFNTRDGIRLGGGKYNVVSGNTANNNGDYAAGIYLVNSDDNIISGNTANNNYRTGIDLQLYNNNNNLSGNVANSNGVDGIRIFRSFNNKISGNTLINNDANGISLAEGDDNIISGNTANYNLDGIKLANSDDNTITGNNATNNDSWGLSLNNCNDHLILGNNISYNNFMGLYLWGSDGNTITGNTVKNNTDFGIYLNTSNYTTVSGNILIGNDECITEINCRGNIFSDNGDCTYGRGNGEPIIPGFSLFFLLGILSVAAIILTKKEKKSKS